MKSFSIRPTQVRNNSNNSKLDPLSTSPNTIATRPTDDKIVPSTRSVVTGCGTNTNDSGGGKRTGSFSSLHQRHVTVVDGGLFAQTARKSMSHSSSSPVPDTTILSVLGEDEQQSFMNCSSSPSTPPKKLWERQYGSFLRNRVRSTASLAADTQVTATAPPFPTTPPSPSKDGSVRGGKLFSHVFRGSDSSLANGRKSSTNIVDELDGTMRRGSDKTHSPRGSGVGRPLKYMPSSVQSSHEESTDKMDSNQPHMNSLTTQSATTVLKPRLSSDFVTLRQPPGGEPIEVPEHNRPVNVPLFFPPRSSQAIPPPPPPSHHHSQFAKLQNELFPAHPNTSIAKSPSIIMRKVAEPRSSSAIIPTPSKSSALKKAFTDFHNTSEDANSAFLGDDPSMSGRALCFARKNEHLVEVGATIKPSKSHGQMLIPDDCSDATTMDEQRRRSCSITHHGAGSLTREHEREVAVKASHRILKQIVGVEAWQTGRRYLIAPAVLAACPSTTVSYMLGQDEPLSVNQAAAESAYFPFGMIVLGECLLTYVTQKSAATMTVKQWSSAKLVLRQNYLLEYDVGADIRTSLPRGYAHLQFARTVLHDHFHDALELHFYGSPCAKEDARILMIRIASAPTFLKHADSTGPTDDAANHRPIVREAWRTCLNRASQLSKVSDLYEYDESNLLGKGQYAEVRAARRRRPTLTGENDNSGATPKYNCALKTFNKNQFWRMVIKGRERADTIVRETSVQATLLALCGQSSSFLRVSGFFETSEQVVLELELLEGTDLFQYIVSKSVLKESEAAVIMRDVLICLDIMTKNGLAHRDVKPANILMCSPSGSVHTNNGLSNSNPRVKIGDFGMAAFVGVDGQVRGRCGTPGYVAPEIFTAGVYGGYGNKVDVFSAGVTLYVMLCGFEPFYGETDEELKEANKAALFDFPKEEWDNVSADAIDLVRQMMQIDPNQRLDARQALEHPWFRKSIPVETSPDQVDSTMQLPSILQTEDTCRLS